MNFSDVLKAMNQASAFELFRMRAAINRVLDQPQWAEAIRSGIGPELAPRETEAITLYAAGLPLKSVATRMGLSQETVKQYLNRCRAKYAAVGRPAQTKTELYRRAIEDGYLEAP